MAGRPAASALARRRTPVASAVRRRDHGGGDGGGISPRARPGGAAKGGQGARDTSEDTCDRERHRPASAEEAEEGHRHYDEYAARHVEPGRWVHSKEPG